MGRLNLAHVVRIESETETYTNSYLKGVKEYFPLIIDTFFQLMYFTGKKDGGTDEGDFHVYCWNQYYHLGYSLRAAFILYEKGYYLEANIILRRLLEVAIKMRFLEKHKSLTMCIWTNEKSFIKDGSKKPSIKDMFDEVAPNLYKEFYGLLLSGFMHGGIGSSIGKIKFKTKDSEVAIGPIWNEDAATFFVNTFTMIALSYLVYFPKVFNENFKNIESDLLQQYEKATEWVRKSLKNHKSKYPHSIPWHNAMSPIITS